MKLTTKIAQDGRFSIMEGVEEINIRTSLVPGAYGESIVMRILDPKTIQIKLEDMGIEPYLFSVIEQEIAKPNGLILVTGPTGSGKTTTLYAFLRKIYTPEIKTITIESASKLEHSAINQVKKVFGEKSEITETINKNLLGGIRIKVDDMVYDASLKKQLSRLKNQLI